jgi:hypothetical protein
MSVKPGHLRSRRRKVLRNAREVRRAAAPADNGTRPAVAGSLPLEEQLAAERRVRDTENV